MATEKTKLWAKRFGVTAVILFVLYVLGGFWGVPLMLRYYALPKLNEEVAGTGEVEAFYSNPFTWELTIKGFKGFTPDGSEALSFAEFRVNVQPTSIFNEEKAIKEIYIDQPFLNLVINEDGKVNIISTLERIQKEAEKQTEESDEPFVIPQIYIGNLQVVNAGFRTQIDSFGRPFVREVQNLSFQIKDMHTNAAHDNAYSFAMETKQGEKFQVNGDLRLDPLSSWGQVSMEQLDLKDFDVFAGDAVGFDLTGGMLDVTINYSFLPMAKDMRMEVFGGHILLTGMSMVARDNPEAEPFERIDRMEITGARLDLLNSNVGCDTFAIDGGLLRVIREKDGVLNLIRYISPPEKHAEIAAKTEREAKAEGTQREIRLGVVSANLDMGVALTSAWQQIQDLVELNWDLEADQVDLSGLSLIWRDEYLNEPAELRWTDITMSATNLTNGDKAFPFQLGLVMNDTGKIALDGQFTATPASTKFEVTAETIPLQVISPYVTNVVAVDLVSGDLSATGKTDIALPDDGLPILSAEVNAQLANLRIDWKDPASKLIAWQNLDLQGVTLTTDPMALVADQVTVTAPYLSAERLADGSIRLPLPEQSHEPAPAETTPASDEAPTVDYKEASVQLTELVIENGEVSISDAAISPAMKFSANQINLRAGPLSYPNIEPTKFDLALNLSNGPSGGVKLAGALDPLQPFEATEMRVNTTAVTLSPFAAYAVPIIGRPPTDGKLTANLGYSITTGEIAGDNKMQIQNMRFGKRAPDTDAPNLPLDLGVAILEDSKGVMHIDVPVKGNINDPKFSLDTMISYAIGNVLEKLVTAPFAALGSLLPGGEEVGNAIAFEPGQSTIAPDNMEVITGLVTILHDRPNLQLTLTPSIDPATDGEALIDAQFQTMLQAKMQESGDDDEDATEALYDALPKTETTPAASDLSLAQQQQAIKDTLQVSTEEMTALAQARADAVLTALTQNGLTADRAKIVESDGAPYAQDGAKVELGLDADIGNG
ncbi:DUF748 domain-containing protein [Cerasicoccus fimbriatus]|uniref:DUF748 domain-containing protein n=1 Tax=Cerasicoccus fimbriatus TaxID=3014554 RepID=UPI0022B31210|nr:DUF748 domain-containing protein [Cerasicoccus sp. TK19100]